MPLNIFVRHTEACLNGEPAKDGKPKRPGLLEKGFSKEKLATYKHCQCPKYFSGTHAGKWHPRTSLKVNTWEEAEQALAKVKDGDLQPHMVTIEDAIEGWFEEVILGGAAASTVTQWKITLRKLAEFCKRQKIRYVQHVDPTTINKWRAEWPLEKTHRSPMPGIRPNTAKSRIDALKLFFKFVRRMRWIKESPMALIKFAKRKEEEEEHQTMPLDVEGDSNYQALLKAIPEYLAQPVRRRVGAMATRPANLVAITELMYETGLRISDATMFDLDTVEEDAEGWGWYTTRQIKTRRMVTVGIPPELLQRMGALERISPRYVFFGGGTLTNFYRAQIWVYLKDAGKLAGVTDMKPHRLRDSFAVNRLNEGMLIQDVSKLLGHSSVVMTERYYAPFVKSRKDALMAKRKAAHGTGATPKVITIRKHRAR